MPNLEILNPVAPLAPDASNPNLSLTVTLAPERVVVVTTTKHQELEQAHKNLSYRFLEIVDQLQNQKIANDARNSGLRFDVLSPEDKLALTELAKVKAPTAENIKQLKEISDRYFEKQPRDFDKAYFDASFDDTLCGAGIKQYVERVKQLEPEAKAERVAGVIDERNKAIEEIYKSLPEEIRKELDKSCSDRTTNESACKILAEAKKYSLTLTDESGFIPREALDVRIRTVEQCHAELGIVAPVETPITPPVVSTPQQQQAKWEQDYFNRRTIEGNNPESTSGGLTRLLSLVAPEALKAINEKQYTDLSDKVSDMLKAFQEAANKNASFSNSPSLNSEVREFLKRDSSTPFTLTPGAVSAMEQFATTLVNQTATAERLQGYSNAVKDLRENVTHQVSHFKNNPAGTALSAQAGVTDSAVVAIEQLLKDPVPAGATQAERLTNLLTGLQRELNLETNRTFKEGPGMYKEELDAFLAQRPPVLNADTISVLDAYSNRFAPGTVEPAIASSLKESFAKVREDFISAKMEKLIDSLLPGTTDKLDAQYLENREARMEALLKAIQAKLNSDDPLSRMFLAMSKETNPEVARFLSSQPPKLDADAMAALSLWIKVNGSDAVRAEQSALIADIKQTQNRF